MAKTILIALLLIHFAYDMLLAVLTIRQRRKPLPEAVADIYEPEAYRRFLDYSSEKLRLGLIERAVSLIVSLALFLPDTFSALYRILPGGECLRSALLLGGYTLLLAILGIPFDWIREMKIEKKYGTGKTSAATFAGDEIKEIVLSLVLNLGLLFVCGELWKAFGIAFVIGTFLILAAFAVLLSLLTTTFKRLFNKFTKLGDGELRDKLTALFRANGYQLGDIEVMDASRRTAKANAFCSGLGKLKKIVLYDTLVNHYSDDEIVAVFAHELGHYKHRDTAKLLAYNLFIMAATTALIAGFVLLPQISQAFGFEGMNLAFGVILIIGVLIEPVMNLLMIPEAAFSRRFEYRADRMAVDAGYGEALADALRKLTKGNMSELNPHPAIVTLEWTHPTLEQRILAIGKADGNDI